MTACLLWFALGLLIGAGAVWLFEAWYRSGK